MKNYILILSISLVLLSSCGNDKSKQQSSNPDTESEAASNANEKALPVWNVNDEILKNYKLSTQNADVKTTRKIFDEFSLEKKIPEEAEITVVDKAYFLKAGDVELVNLMYLVKNGYLPGKFVLLQANNKVKKGIVLTVIFKSRPDKIFDIWMVDSNNKWKMKTINVNKEMTGKLENILYVNKNYLSDVRFEL